MMIPEKLKNLTEYVPQSGEFPVRLDANESFFDLNDETKAKINQAIKSLNFNRYPDPMAQKLCRLAADFYGVKVENIVCGNGSDELISVIMNSFLSAGDEVVVLQNDFSMYEFYGNLAGLRVTTIPKKNGLFIDMEEVKQKISEKGVRMFIFSNPCNPTGQGITAAEVLGIVNSTNAIVVIDEAYMDFWNQSSISLIEQYPNAIILRTASKAVGLAGIRLGFAIGQKEMVDYIKKAKSPYNVNQLTQTVGEIVYEYPKVIDQNVQQILLNKEELINQLTAFDVIDTKTNFILIKDQNAAETHKRLMENGVLVRKIMGEYLRVTVGSCEENQIFIEMLREGI